MASYTMSDNRIIYVGEIQFIEEIILLVKSSVLAHYMRSNNFELA